jgi:hypothetical protein
VNDATAVRERDRVADVLEDVEDAVEGIGRVGQVRQLASASPSVCRESTAWKSWRGRPPSPARGSE